MSILAALLIGVIPLGGESWRFAKASCGFEFPPLRQQVEDAESIFIGVAVSESEEKDPKGALNRKLRVRVERVLKGSYEPGNEVTLYFKLSDQYLCEPGTLGTQFGSIKKAFRGLYFVEKKEGLPFISEELIRQNLEIFHKRKEVEEVEKILGLSERKKGSKKSKKDLEGTVKKK